MTWQLQEAKQRFSEVVREAVAGSPQTITKHGEEVAVVVSIDDYRRMSGPKISFAEYLLSGPTIDDLDIERDRSLPREIDLDELI
ncbi:prevent-host-death family protein [Nocardioides albertanoniae]|uniref:Antitoxin n=1 Tax=Nocardioides albertanoniae TaxID=1175486 RepID=A0A543A161_9ACTN|nr:type II toxin-antitoxin system Phd/YefM family antitoxin [Nocardioides albertanoniae]TQL66260.1 prevent-host-death family protein [Nocardioides albertanoniae]